MENKKTIVIFSGWGTDIEVWAPLSEKLSESHNIEIIQWDQMIDGARLFERFTTIMSQAVGNGVDVIGWSMGALAIQGICQEFSHQINRIAFIDGTSKFTVDKPSGYLNGWKKTIVKRMIENLKVDKSDVMKQFHKNLFTKEEVESGFYEKMEKGIERTIENCSAEELARGLNYLIEQDQRKGLPYIESPVLLIHGEKDLICPVGASEYIRDQVDGAELVIVENSGHCPFFTEPTRIANLINDFFRKD